MHLYYTLCFNLPHPRSIHSSLHFISLHVFVIQIFLYNLIDQELFQASQKPANIEVLVFYFHVHNLFTTFFCLKKPLYYTVKAPLYLIKIRGAAFDRQIETILIYSLTSFRYTQVTEEPGSELLSHEFFRNVISMFK